MNQKKQLKMYVLTNEMYNVIKSTLNLSKLNSVVAIYTEASMKVDKLLIESGIYG